MTIKEIKSMLRSREMERIYPAKTRNAVVLIPIVETKDGPGILFEVRGEGIRQGGEVCFPGGRMDENEKPSETAIRETTEELLIRREQVEIVAPMHTTMQGSGGAEVQSFLGILHDYEGTYSDAEVSRVFSVPLKWFREHKPLLKSAHMSFEGTEDFPYDLIPGGQAYRWHKVPRNFYFWVYENSGEEHGQRTVIWGLTGELLYHCLQAMDIYER